MNDNIEIIEVQGERVFWRDNVAEPKTHPLRPLSHFFTTGQAAIDQVRFESDVAFSGEWAARGCYFEGAVTYDSERTRFDACYFQNGYPEGPGEPGRTLERLKMVPVALHPEPQRIKAEV